jgi:hypothetical protein
MRILLIVIVIVLSSLILACADIDDSSDKSNVTYGSSNAIYGLAVYGQFQYQGSK